jgi:hypothetical protein
VIRECTCTFSDDGEVIAEAEAEALNSRAAACQAAFNKGQPPDEEFDFVCR